MSLMLTNEISATKYNQENDTEVNKKIQWSLSYIDNQLIFELTGEDDKFLNITTIDSEKTSTVIYFNGDTSVENKVSNEELYKFIINLRNVDRGNIDTMSLKFNHEEESTTSDEQEVDSYESGLVAMSTLGSNPTKLQYYDKDNTVTYGLRLSFSDIEFMIKSYRHEINLRR